SRSPPGGGRGGRPRRCHGAGVRADLQCPRGAGVRASACGIVPIFAQISIRMDDSMMKGQLAGLMRQAQQMQENMKKAQAALAEIVVEGASGGGLVKASMSCKHDVRRVSIDPSLFDDDRDMIEDLVAAAFNDALRKAETTAQEKMSEVTAGMSLPPGMKLPF